MTKEQKKAYNKKWREENKDKLKEYLRIYRLQNKEKIRQQRLEYYKENREEILKRMAIYNQGRKTELLEANRRYRSNNKEKIAEYHKVYRKKWYLENRELILLQTKKYVAERLKTDPIYRMKYNIRQRVRGIFRKMRVGKTVRTHKLLGIGYKELASYIESLFKDGMCWEKVGKEIHIDHIIPLSSAKNEQELIKLCHYTNLQPLWASENLHKSNKLDFYKKNV